MAEAVHRPDLTKEVVLSCPACWQWQLHYTPTELVPTVFKDDVEMDFVIERLLREHVAHECPKPLFFAQLARSRGLI